MAVDSWGKRLRRWRQSRSDERLFRELGDTHDLAEDQLELLVALADQHRLVRLSEIFLRPSLFSVNPDPERWRDKDLARVGQRIFEGSAESSEPTVR